MKTIFTDDFSNKDIVNWKTEQHTPDGYSDFIIRNGMLVMLDAGNRLLPRIPALKTMAVSGSFETDLLPNEHRFSLQIHLDYDPKQRKGTVIDLISDGKALTVFVHKDKDLTVKGKPNSKLLADIVRNGVVNFEIRADGNMLKVWVNKEKLFSGKVERREGIVALSRGVFIGELRLKSFSINSNDRLEEQIVWDRLEIPFEPINGMDNPIIWTLSAKRTGDVVRLDATLSGGCVDREVIPWFPYHGRYIEELTEPYLRIEADGKTFELNLSDKTLSLCHDPQKYFYMLGPEKPEWPLKREFFLDMFNAANSVFFCGYRAYNARAANKHQAAGPSETAYDLKSKKVIYYGEALKRCMATVELLSPEDKQICKKLNPRMPGYEKALQFARNNHYFSENEECSFLFEIYSRMGNANDELRLDYCLQNAFFEPMGKYKQANLRKEMAATLPDTEKIRSAKISFNRILPGVYHMHFRLWQGHRLLKEKTRAFEIYSRTQSGPEASGLPVLFSAPTEIMGLETDYFDPWKPDCVDVSHYISVGTAIMPHFAREKRLWEVYRLYHREWLLFMTSRTSNDLDLEHNRDLVENCDYILALDDLRGACLIRLCCRVFYRKALLEALYEFSKKIKFLPGQIKACIDKKCLLDKELFKELMEKHLYEWLEFFNEKLIESLKRNKAQIAEMNKHAKYSSGGPVSVYAAAYKTAHSVRYTMGLKPSREAQEMFNGLFAFEDYPHACRYSINRAPFLLADMKMKFPKWKIYPEMYTPWGEPCPDAAVARAWPSVGIWNDDFPLDCSIKRVLEFVYASVWHDGSSFKYWGDYGFQTRVWERERYEALLKIWGFIDKARAARPFKANAFICNEACCLNHEVHYDEYPGDGHEPAGDLFNTAEEVIPYSYEMSRSAGQNAGFIADFKALEKLGPDDIDTLLLPPLTKIGGKELESIRRLHEHGVSLLAFEEVGGLEDLFGVEEGGIRQVNNISVNKELAANPLMGLSSLEEYTEHRACRGKYKSSGADVLLNGEIPVLFANKTRWGKTALFNIPPTVVRRQDQFHRVCFGRDSISALINESVKLILKYLSNPEVETDAGKIIAFKDIKGNSRIIIEEDAHPFPQMKINPLLTIRLPGIKKDKINCNKDFSIVSLEKETVKIRLSLEKDEFAILTVGK